MPEGLDALRLGYLMEWTHLNSCGGGISFFAVPHVTFMKVVGLSPRQLDVLESAIAKLSNSLALATGADGFS